MRNVMVFTALALCMVAVSLSLGCGQDEEIAPVPIDTVTPDVIATPDVDGAQTPLTRDSTAASTPTPYSGGIPSRALTAVRREPTPLPIVIECGIFEFPEDAQEFFLEHGGPLEDRYQLDTNGDGIACNSSGDAGFAGRIWAGIPTIVGQPTPTMEPVPSATPPVVEAQTEAPEQRIRIVRQEGDVVGFYGETRVAVICDAQVGDNTKTGAEDGSSDWTWDEEGNTCSRPSASIDIPDGPAGTPTPEPLELWEVDWHAFEEKDYVRTFEEGERLIAGAWLQSLRGHRQVCGTQIGTALDASNPTWSAKDRTAFLWVDMPGDEPDFCVGAEWTGFQEVFPIPLYTTAGSTKQVYSTRVEPHRVRQLGDDIVFPSAYELREFTLPPDYGAVYDSQKWGRALPLIDTEPQAAYIRMVEIRGEEKPLVCVPERLPIALWTDKEGFMPLTDDELRRLKASVRLGKYDHFVEMERTDEDLEMMELAREFGWYFIISEYRETSNYCWRVGNHEDVSFDPRPCIECYDRSK
ncbi:MAG: hypothetical protein OXI16_13985 [Chloroflexota bacterium]|nr:hypothetical protein [Chloroflexota bacterium]